ncbi:MAG TPA: DUF4105 domain-containing protein [Methylomirabilota bacterium]|nr:DUF4105 domain-containing protein [Methylomirabilota bacterium]
MKAAAGMRLLVAVACSAALVVPGASAAAGQPDGLPVDVDTVEVYLLTYEPGDELQTMWGHVALRVRDARTGTDLVFDWGLVDAGNPFALIARFLVGTPTYHLSVQAYSDMVRAYAAESRTFRQERLTLDRLESTRLVHRLAWNARPEHRPYPYDMWRRNCVTQIRDLLDEAVAGRIADRLWATRGNGTRRELLRSALRPWPLVARGLDVVLNAEVDRPLSAWEEVFLPEKLREQLRAVPASADAAAPAASLLGESEPLIAAPGRPRLRRSGGYLVASGLGALAIAGLAHATRLTPRRLNVRIVGAGVFGFGFLSALLGTLMVFAWITSPHTLLHHNANLWLFWPLDWVVAAFGVSLLVKGEPWPSTSRRGRVLHGLIRAHLLAAGAFVTLWALGTIHQAVTPVIVGFVSLAGLVYGSAWRALSGVPGGPTDLSRGPAS